MDENVFWNRVCGSLFIKNPAWYGIVSSLPDKLDLSTCLKRTVSAEVLVSMGIRAQGWVGRGIQQEIKPNPLQPTDFPLAHLQWAFFQFAAQFFIMEGMYNYLIESGVSDPSIWPADTVREFIELAQTMTFYSAMVILCEEKRLPDFPELLETPIRDEVRKIVNTLTNKTQDYGQAFLRHGVLGLLHRVWDKIARYATLSAENRASKFESRKDTATDMLGYSVLIWSILEDMKARILEENSKSCTPKEVISHD